MSFVDDDTGNGILPGDLPDPTKQLRKSATAFAAAITGAFAQATTGGKQFDDVLKSLALRLSNLSVQAAMKPLAKEFAKGLSSLFGTIFGNGGDPTSGRTVLTPFASGGVIGAPTYFPLSAGGRIRPRGDRAAHARPRWPVGRQRRRTIGARQHHRANHDTRRAKLPALGGLSHRPDRARRRARTTHFVRPCPGRGAARSTCHKRVYARLRRATAVHRRSGTPLSS
jgi:hypothetical protein